MDWIKVKIETTGQGIEAVSGRLLKIGITGLEIEDDTEFNDYIATHSATWDYVEEGLVEQKSGKNTVAAYVSDNAAGRDTLSSIRREVEELSQLRDGTDYGSLTISLEGVDEEDWANNWKQYFKPIYVGERIIIKPEWEELEAPEGKIIFTVNPGMNFGTGSHQTTRLCVAALDKYVSPDDLMLDIGCGSGILSVIALLLGAREAWAVDIDPNAADNALENARLNGLSEGCYHASTGDILSDRQARMSLSTRKYNVIAANIVADIIIPLADYVKDMLAEGGIFISSGIITERSGEVIEALERSGMRVLETCEEDGWCAVICSVC
ncbi:MAG: 50S ribosomal protein L11 methyltransferase [Eubacteriales bacterium]